MEALLKYRRKTQQESRPQDVRQYSVADWVAEFLRNPAALSQLGKIEARSAIGLPLATWEQNCLEAHRRMTRAA